MGVCVCVCVCACARVCVCVCVCVYVCGGVVQGLLGISIPALDLKYKSMRLWTIGH